MTEFEEALTRLVREEVSKAVADALARMAGAFQEASKNIREFSPDVTILPEERSFEGGRVFTLRTDSPEPGAQVLRDLTVANDELMSPGSLGFLVYQPGTDTWAWGDTPEIAYHQEGSGETWDYWRLSETGYELQEWPDYCII